MSITLSEKVGSREWSGGSVTFHYVLAGTSDDLAAMEALLDATAQYYDTLRREANPTIEPIWVDEGAADGEWACQVRYNPVTSGAAPEPGDSAYRFETGGGSTHITQSLQTIGSYAASGSAPNFKGAIGVTPDSVEGVDIVTPVYEWSETHYFGDSAVTLDYRKDLFRLTGRVNNDAFKGLDAGECLFRGASGSKRGDDDWEISFRFAGSPNRTNLTVGDIGSINKKGWEYLWIRYEDVVDSAAKRLVKRPLAAYVEKVYETDDFSKLGIGT